MFRLSCSSCPKDFPLDFRGWKCPACGGLLKLSPSVEFKNLDEIVHKERAGVWRYGGDIPFPSTPVTLGEGNTPLVKAHGKGIDLFFKLEYVSPSGSFKDRGASVSLTRAKALGVRGIVEDSTGNAGIAASAYAARAGIGARIYVPADAPAGKKWLMRACGAEVVECESREEASASATSRLGKDDLYIGHTWDPFYIEGMKTVAFEIFESGIEPGAFIVPVASGTLLLGLFHGYRELLSAGLIDEMPRIFGVQGEGCAPIFEDFHGKVPIGQGSGLADGLRIVNPPRRKEIHEAIESTAGDVFVVSDPEIRIAMRELYGMGIMAEPTSATAFAALRKEKGRLGERVVVPITGSGLKNLEGVRRALNPLRVHP